MLLSYLGRGVVVGAINKKLNRLDEDSLFGIGTIVSYGMDKGLSKYVILLQNMIRIMNDNMHLSHDKSATIIVLAKSDTRANKDLSKFRLDKSSAIPVQ